jgi:mannitol-1-phosphate 5-dehydrogenase
LVPLAPGAGRAFLVEAFNRILISHIDFGAEGGPFQRGIRVFAEKVSLLPFEEAKLYGHNAVHALAAYVGAARGAKRVADLSAMPEMMAFLREAFLEESGEALVRRHSGIDPLFTREGYAEYADDLLRRMTNPYLGDTIERVGRDPARKLGWDDRLVGTMRVALSQGVEPKRFATGVAAALVFLDPGFRASGRPASGLLDPLWIQAAVDPAERSAILRLVEASSKSIRIRGRGRPSASASPGNPQ